MKRNTTEPFVLRTIEMHMSPAFWALCAAAHKILACLENEHSRHRGQNNGNLILTYDQLAARGLRRSATSAAFRELEALGFVVITQKGCAGAGKWRRPTLYRLTYLDSVDGKATNEWRKITEDQARLIADQARRAPRPRRKKFQVVVSAQYL
jgi:hypothetical protein